jgi:hypothetical protein
MAQKTMGAILNEAADANERGMESSRRSALTNLQIKGQVADQNYQEEQRGRDREFYGGMKAAAQKHLFKDEMIPGTQAITGAPGEVLQPAQTRRIPIDLSTSDGLKAIGAFQQEVFQLRASQGRITGEEMGQLLNFRKTLDQAGATEEFKAALGGDQTAIASLSKRLGVGGAVKITSGFDDAGMPQIFALTRTEGSGGKLVEQKVPVGHLLAAISPDVDAMLKSQREGVKFGDDLQNSASTRLYQDRQGRAALQNADARTSAANKRMADSDAYRTLSDLDSKNATRYLAPGFTVVGPTGKAETVTDDMASGLVHSLGALLIEQEDFSGGKAYNTARDMVARLGTQAKSRYERELVAAQTERDRLISGGGNAEQIKQARNKVFELEENGVARWQQYRQELVDSMLSRANQGK